MALRSNASHWTAAGSSVPSSCTPHFPDLHGVGRLVHLLTMGEVGHEQVAGTHGGTRRHPITKGRPWRPAPMAPNRDVPPTGAPVRRWDSGCRRARVEAFEQLPDGLGRELGHCPE